MLPAILAPVALLFAQPPDGGTSAAATQPSAATAPAAAAQSPTPDNQPAPTAPSAPTPAEPAGAESTPSATPDELLRRIEALETAAAERTTPARSTAGAFVQNRFNPDLSLITDFTGVWTNRTDQTLQGLAVPGFIDASNRENKLRGINLHYLEMAFSCAVDPYFDFFGVVALSPTEVGVEEAYVDTRQLPFGFQLRLGKFLSAFGRLNGQHQHYWDFYDQPLVYEAFMGLEGWKNPGVRLSWTAPFDYLLQLNLEVFQGVNDESPTFNATGYDLATENGTHLLAKAPFVPALYVGSLKTSFDFGDNVILLGASVMYGHATQARSEGTPADTAYSAAGTILYNAELTYKYLLSSYRSITWQSEYLGLLSSGDLAQAADGRVHQAEKRQGGLYSQLIGRFERRWRLGARFDLLAQNSYTVDGAEQALDSMLQRYTAMLEFSPTELSRFRLQYAYDRSRFLEGARRDVHEVLLQMNIAVGPHGAHSF